MYFDDDITIRLWGYVNKNSRINFIYKKKNTNLKVTSLPLNDQTSVYPKGLQSKMIIV